MSNSSKRALVTGAGGFIGSHLVDFLAQKGYWVRGVDIKRSEFMTPKANEFLVLDLREEANCRTATQGIDEVYNLAANMGGIGFIETVHAEIMHDNVLINTHMLESAFRNRVKRYFFSSSACIYPTYRQEDPDNPGLKEVDAYPADCDNEYGWEKLYTERLCKAYWMDRKFETRVARFHNIYGPHGTWTGGREKAPAAICRKVAETPAGGEIRIWGDGSQSRSFCYVDDCLEGIWRLMQSDFREPLNIGSDELVTINQLVDIVEGIAGKSLKRVYELNRPQGVRGRNSDNTLLRQVLNWEPERTLKQGLSQTYPWVAEQVRKNAQAK